MHFDIIYAFATELFMYYDIVRQYFLFIFNRSIDGSQNLFSSQLLMRGVCLRPCSQDIVRICFTGQNIHAVDIEVKYQGSRWPFVKATAAYCTTFRNNISRHKRCFQYWMVTIWSGRCLTSLVMDHMRSFSRNLVAETDFLLHRSSVSGAFETGHLPFNHTNPRCNNIPLAVGVYSCYSFQGRGLPVKERHLCYRHFLVNT